MNQPEMTLPDLPPRRPLPPDVRERMRRRVVGGGAVRAPLAAAAAVAVLAAGGAIITQSTQGDTIAVAPPTSTSSTTYPPDWPAWSDMTVVTPGANERDAAKCGFASADVRFTFALPGRRVLAATGDRFCELTHIAITHNTAVTVPLADGAASLLWQSGSGVLIGRSPVGTRGVEVSVPLQSGGAMQGPATQAEELFVIARSAMRMSVVFTMPTRMITGDVDVEALPGQDAWTVRQEVLPPGDPLVAQCVDASLRDGKTWVGDPMRWRAGASSAPGVNALLVMRDEAGETAYCHVYHGRGSSAEPGVVLTAGSRFQLRHVSGGDLSTTHAHVVLGGTVDTTVVGGVEIVDARGRTTPATLADGTFAVRLDDQPPLDYGRQPPGPLSRAKGLEVRVLDHRNQVIESVTL